ITESALLEDTRAARVVFDQLKDLGVWLYLDDFGTGSSSLSCLYTIPLSGLKIDRDFMGGLSTHPGHKAVFEAIVNIARAFNLKIVAEGIETTEQYELLRRLKVDYGQGYLLGKPVSAEQAERLLSGLPTLCHV
ncbi:MAG: EAL domain-containing protein, partial [Planctomycetes bacterium]|nr:EAL domain-containing protein [Planctomycetota bacterium]